MAGVAEISVLRGISGMQNIVYRIIVFDMSYTGEHQLSFGI